MDLKAKDVLALIGEDGPQQKKVQVPESLLSFVKQELLQLKVKLAQQEAFTPEAGKVKAAWALHDVDAELAHKMSAAKDESFTQIQDFDLLEGK